MRTETEPREPFLPADVARCTSYPMSVDLHSPPCPKRESCLRYLCADIDAWAPMMSSAECVANGIQQGKKFPLYIPYRP